MNHTIPPKRPAQPKELKGETGNQTNASRVKLVLCRSFGILSEDFG